MDVLKIGSSMARRSVTHAEESDIVFVNEKNDRIERHNRSQLEEGSEQLIVSAYFPYWQRIKSMFYLV